MDFGLQIRNASSALILPGLPSPTKAPREPLLLKTVHRTVFRARRTHWRRPAKRLPSHFQRMGHRGRWFENGILGTVPSVPFWRRQNKTKALTHNEWDIGDGGKPGRKEPSPPSRLHKPTKYATLSPHGGHLAAYICPGCESCGARRQRDSMR